LIEKAASMIQPYRSIHGSFHANRIIDILGNMIPDNVLNHFNELECFSLLSSAYLHDIGLLVEPSAKRNHAATTAEFINSNFDHLGLDPFEATIVATICRAHAADFDIFSTAPVVVVGRHQVRVRFLAALLRLADALDVDFRSAPPYFDPLTLDPSLTTRWRIHQSISGVLFVPDKGEIQIHFIRSREKPLEEAFQAFAKSLRREIDSIGEILLENDVPYRKITFKMIGYSRGE
jgi:hypothetical protein